MEFHQAHISSLFENATEGFIITNHQARILMANPAACRMFGHGPDELEHQPIELLIPQALRAQHVGLRNGFYQHPHNRVMGQGRDLKGQRKDGSVFPVEVSLSTYVHNGERYVIAFIVDITHRKRIEENVLAQQQQLAQAAAAVQAMNSQLEARVEERTEGLRSALQQLQQSQQELHEALAKERELHELKGRFVAMASHEFRTPLSTILSSANLVARYPSTADHDKRDRHVGKIKNAVHHLNTLLEDFLTLGRLEDGRMTARPAQFNLVELVQELVDEMSVHAKPGQRFSHEHQGPEQIFADASLLKNALLNLLSNAIKFSPEGGEISIRTKQHERMMEMVVADQGIGIAEEELPHLFSTFFRATNATHIQGTGLGLHIVQRYVALMQGQVKVESSLGKGTAIAIFLPQTS